MKIRTCSLSTKLKFTLSGIGGDYVETSFYFSKPALIYKPEYLWPPYTSKEQVSMILKAGDKYHGLLNSFKREECNFWRSIRDIEYETFLSSLTNKIDPKTAAVSSTCKFFFTYRL